MGRILLIFIFVSFRAWGGSCCGQVPTSFTVLSQEQPLSVLASYSLSETEGRVFNSDDFYVWSDKERVIQTYQLGLAGSLFYRHQIFFNTSLQQGKYSDPGGAGVSQHLSDTQVGYTYETLPEYSFSYWKPIVYFSLIGNLPTGKSAYEKSDLSEGADVTGYNQWGLGLGVTLRKVYFPLTLTLQVKTLKLFSKQFESVQVSDFYDHSVAFLSNYVTRFYDIGFNLGVTFHQISERKVSTVNQPSGVSQSTTVLLGLQKVLTDAWSGGVTYADETLLGRPRNTVLNKTYSLYFNYSYF
ncbi:MAG: hypothetical protein KDD34_08575 [Bdellovibrionales bacterium]|nr:hypothetical protein [Bdellovibrionales bacterium]